MTNLNTEATYQFQIKATLEGGAIYTKPDIITIEVKFEPANLPDFVNFAPIAVKSFDMWTYIINETKSLNYTSPKIKDLENNTISIEPLDKMRFYDFKYDQNADYFELFLHQDILKAGTYELKFKLTDNVSSQSSIFMLTIRILQSDLKV